MQGEASRNKAGHIAEGVEADIQGVLREETREQKSAMSVRKRSAGLQNTRLRNVRKHTRNLKTDAALHTS